MQKNNTKPHEDGGDDEGQDSKQVIVHEPGEVMPTAYNLPNEAQIKEYETFLGNYDKFVMRVLKDGTDYGVIPGVDKPTLLKPGAEKLEKLFFLRSKKECILREVTPNGDFIRYTYRTSVFNKAGQLVSTCEGTCNSKEKKYRSQTVFDNQATEEQKANGKLEERTSKAGKKYKVYVIEKPDFYDLENTIMKMAQKRSYVGAILEATNSSSRFTQDVEDMEIIQTEATASKPSEVDKPRATAKVATAMFDKVKKSIEGITDEKILTETKAKIEKSDKYTDDQKKELVELISKRVSEIKK